MAMHPIDDAGQIGGLLLILLGALTLSTAKTSAQTLTTIYTFTGSDGANPEAGLIADASGNLYGTTASGGANNFGTVFKVTPSGTETVLYSFGASSSDGLDPVAGLIADASGNLYGTTVTGGANINYGTVFELTPPTQPGLWAETVLYTFGGTSSDGQGPYAGLIADASGNLYGTTLTGGANIYGTAFKLTPTQSGPWSESVLYSFSGGSDGGLPSAGLIADASGNLYGTTYNGGVNDVGTVFKLTPTQLGSWTETVLHSFTGGSDGANPQAGLIADASGNLYGTTNIGGGTDKFGTVFKVTPSGSETVLYSFTGGSDGANPQAGLIADVSGNLYGTTVNGGASGKGTVFKVTPSGSETVLYSFTGGSDGANPQAGLIADASGNLYGTTVNGGANLFGTVFKLALPAQFKGVPGQPNCYGQSISFMASKYGGLAHAATSLGYSGIAALQSGVTAYCGGM